MPILGSTANQTPVAPPTGNTPGNLPGTGGGSELATFNFVVGWILLLVILTFINKSRFGHVIIYYSLLLVILLILVTEYAQFTPYFGAIQTIGQLNGIGAQPPTNGGTF